MTSHVVDVIALCVCVCVCVCVCARARMCVKAEALPVCYSIFCVSHTLLAYILYFKPACFWICYVASVCVSLCILSWCVSVRVFVTSV